MFDIRPDFIVIGARTLLDGREGVQLVASNEVASTSIDMELSADDGYFLRNGVEPPLSLSANLKAVLRSFALVYGPDYASAWADLLRMSNPDESSGRVWRSESIEPPRLQLPPGT